MPEMRKTLRDDALDFVLKGRGPERERRSDADTGEPTATIRGELSHVNLRDIFQTLTMSQMSGTLRVNAGWEPTYVRFRGNKIRVLPPADLQMRRLGSRLLASGLMDAKDVRTAIFQYRRNGGDLGLILEATGKIERVQFEAIRLALEEDFLLELFTLQRGAFAFFKEICPMPGLEQRFEHAVEFEVEQVLLEIARKSDEWKIIHQVLGDLDEVFIRTSNPPSEDRNDTEDDVYNLVDGKQSLRDIAGGMLDSLFDVAKAAQRLHEQGAIEQAPAYHLIALARSALASQEPRQAFQHLTLVRENRKPTQAEQEEVAELLVDAGDTKTGAEVLALSARLVVDLDHKLEILHRARDLDSLNRTVLEQLVEALQQPELIHQSEEYFEAATRLSQIYVDAGEHEQALALIEQLESEHLNQLPLVARKARILLRMDRKAEAFAALTELAKTFRLRKDNENLVKTLEQILKLDPWDAQARGELKSLIEGRGVKRVRFLALALLALIGLRVAWGLASSYWSSISGRSKLDEVKQLVEQGKLEEGQKVVQALVGDLGESPVGAEARDLLRHIKTRRAAEEGARRRKTLNALYNGLKGAVAMLEARQYAPAIIEYDKLLKKYGGVKEHAKRVRRSLNARFQSLFSGMVEEIESVEAVNIDIASAETPGQRRELFEQLNRYFQDSKLDALTELNQLIERDPSFEKLDALPPKFFDTIDDYLKIGEEIRTKRTALGALIASDNKKIQLNETFVRASEAENKLDFREAYAQIDKLARNWTGDPETAKLFARKREYYSNIIKELELLKQATERGDYDAAVHRLRNLRTIDRRVPFEELVELPFRIETYPPGAEVLNHGNVVGKTPLLFRYSPTQDLVLRISLAGFRSVLIPSHERARGSFKTSLEMQPFWELKLSGAFTNETCYDAKNEQLIVTDRSGVVWTFSLESQKEGFRKRFEDLSGDLGIPHLLSGRFLLPARDGRLRCIDVKNGDVLWTERIGKRLISPVIPAGDNVWIASESGVLHLVSTEDGRVLATEKHAGRMRHAPVFDGQRTLCYVDRDGTIIWCDRQGRELRRHALKKAGWVRPVFANPVWLVASDDRHLYAFSPSGNVQWRVDLGYVLRHPPVVVDHRVFAATGRKELLEIDLEGGTILRRIQLSARPSGPPAVVDGILFQPLEGKGVIANRLADMTPFCRLSDGLTTELPIQQAGPRFFVYQSAHGILRLYKRSLLRGR